MDEVLSLILILKYECIYTMQHMFVCMYIHTYDTIGHAMYLEIAFEGCPWLMAISNGNFLKSISRL